MINTIYKSNLSPERLKMGKPGEDATIQYLEANKQISVYYDFTNNSLFWPVGIDFRAISKTGEVIDIETKTIKNNNKNIRIQIYKIDLTRKYTYKSGCKPGWFYTSESKYLFVYHEDSCILYLFDFEKFREWYDINRMNGIFQIKAFTDAENKGYLSVDVLIPIEIAKTVAYKTYKIVNKKIKQTKLLK